MSNEPPQSHELIKCTETCRGERAGNAAEHQQPEMGSKVLRAGGLNFKV